MLKVNSINMPPFCASLIKICRSNWQNTPPRYVHLASFLLRLLSCIYPYENFSQKKSPNQYKYKL